MTVWVMSAAFAMAGACPLSLRDLTLKRKFLIGRFGPIADLPYVPQRASYAPKSACSTFAQRLRKFYQRLCCLAHAFDDELCGGA